MAGSFEIRKVFHFTGNSDFIALIIEGMIYTSKGVREYINSDINSYFYYVSLENVYVNFGL